MADKISWSNETRKLSELEPWARNPRQINKRQAERLVESFDRFGQVETIAVGPHNEVYNGHQRLNVLKEKYGDDYEVAVRVASRALTEKEREKLVIFLHKGAAGDWDFDMLANEFELDDLLEWGFEPPELDLDLWSPEPPEDVEPQIDKAEELREKWGVKLGDLWQLGSHRLICGDCTDKAVVERVMGGEKAELLFTSPPYPDMRTYDNKTDLSVEKTTEFISSFRDYANYQVINLGIKRQNNEIVQYWDQYIAKAKENGYKFLSWNVWNREQATGIGLQEAFFPIFHEWIFVFGFDIKEINRTIPKSDGSYERQKYKAAGTRRKKDGSLEIADKGNMSFDFVKMGTVTTMKAANTIGNSIHPAVFPVELPSEYIKAMTSEKDCVCDPFSGSGTTLIACEQLGRKCRAIEISPAYCAVAIQRWVDVTGGVPELIANDS